MGDQPPAESRGIYPADIGLMVTRSWEVLQPMLLPAALGAAALAGIGLVIQFGFMGVNMAIQFTVAAAADETLQAVGVALLIGSQLLGSVLGIAATVLTKLGYARGATGLVRTGSVDVPDFLPLEPWLILRGAGAYLLYVLVVTLLSFLLIVPGVIAAVGLCLWPYAMMIEGHGPIDALKRSWQLTDGAKLPLGLFWVCTSLLSIPLALVTCGGGLLVMLPFTSVGEALVFEGARANKPEFAG